MFLKGIEDLRNIEFARSYLWDCKFTDAPSPFNEWFPAEEVQEPVTAIEDGDTMVFDLLTVDFPSKIGRRKMSIKFFDDQWESLEEYFKSWAESIVDIGGGVVPLVDACRQVSIAKLTPQRKVKKYSYYWIYPSRAMINVLNSTNTLKVSNLEFNVAGEKHEFQSLKTLEGKIGAVRGNFDIVSAGLSELSDTSIV